jgi:LPPG:FO 2-phospho-L-lactate transferase
VLVALAGGVGAARLLAGLVRVVDPAEITAVINTGDDMVLHGLHISPDIDTVTYTLAGMHNQELGWGISGETWTVMDALEQLGGEHWFRLGDRDLATHLFRSQRLAEGATLASVTDELARARGLTVRLLPVSNDPIRTRLTLAGGDDPGTEVDFQHYFVRLRHGVAVAGVRFEGRESARPSPGVLEAIAGAETIVVCPSNPVVSIGPILAVPGMHEALRARRAAVVAVSPIVAGQALKGPADRLLSELGHESSAIGVARLYADWVGTLVIDEADRALAGAVEAEGVRCVVAPTIMSTTERAATLAKTVLAARDAR